MIDVFAPPSLAGLAGAPVFLLRREVRRGLRCFGYHCQASGLVHHEPREFRTEALKALKVLWTPAELARHAPRVVALWAALEAGEALASQDQSDLDDLVARLAEESPPLRRLADDNDRFQARSAKIAISLVVAGWNGSPIAYRLDCGRADMATLDAMEEHLLSTFGPAGELAWLALTSECLLRLGRKIEPPTPPPVAKPRRRKSKGDPK